MNFRISSLGAVGLAATLLLPIGIAVLLCITVMAPMREERSVEVLLERIRATRASDLEALFKAADYAWPPSSGVPRLALKRLPKSMETLPIEIKKTLFFRLVLPLVLAENQRVSNQRELLLRLFSAGDLVHGSREFRLASHVALEYGVSGDLNSPRLRALLLRRIDRVPVALALAQAANESAWGTSRFAREGNSLFGQWTWVRGQGLVPFRRAPGKGHLVRSFSDLRMGVRAYIHNLNVGHAYGRFRGMRQAMRVAGKPLDPMALAVGLRRYSERGADYVEEIRWLMRDNRLLALSADAALR
jgi:Bax protein